MTAATRRGGVAGVTIAQGRGPLQFVSRRGRAEADAPRALPEPDDAESWSGRTGIRYLTLEVEDVAATALAVEAKGGKVVLPPFELRPGRFVSQAEDPDGNMLEIGQG